MDGASICSVPQLDEFLSFRGKFVVQSLQIFKQPGKAFQVHADQVELLLGASSSLLGHVWRGNGDDTALHAI